MGIMNEKRQREVDKYLCRLVRKQPTWLRDLFDLHRVNFIIDPSGILSLEVHPELDERTKKSVAFMVEKYLTHHPATFLETRNIQ